MAESKTAVDAVDKAVTAVTKQQSANAQVRDAKRALTKARTWHGKDSAEYEAAQRRLNAAQKNLRRAHGAERQGAKARSDKKTGENQK